MQITYDQPYCTECLTWPALQRWGKYCIACGRFKDVSEDKPVCLPCHSVADKYGKYGITGEPENSSTDSRLADDESGWPLRESTVSWGDTETLPTWNDSWDEARPDDSESLEVESSV